MAAPGKKISRSAQIDMNELLRCIDKALCPECRAKFKEIKVPLRQSITVGELLK